MSLSLDCLRMIHSRTQSKFSRTSSETLSPSGPCLWPPRLMPSGCKMKTLIINWLQATTLPRAPQPWPVWCIRRLLISIVAHARSPARGTPRQRSPANARPRCKQCDICPCKQELLSSAPFIVALPSWRQRENWKAPSKPPTPHLIPPAPMLTCQLKRYRRRRQNPLKVARVLGRQQARMMAEPKALSLLVILHGKVNRKLAAVALVGAVEGLNPLGQMRISR